jgi:hypothetical protein
MNHLTTMNLIRPCFRRIITMNRPIAPNSRHIAPTLTIITGE